MFVKVKLGRTRTQFTFTDHRTTKHALCIEILLSTVKSIPRIDKMCIPPKLIFYFPKPPNTQSFVSAFASWDCG